MSLAVLRTGPPRETAETKTHARIFNLFSVRKLYSAFSLFSYSSASELILFVWWWRLPRPADYLPSSSYLIQLLMNYIYACTSMSVAFIYFVGSQQPQHADEDVYIIEQMISFPSNEPLRRVSSHEASAKYKYNIFFFFAANKYEFERH